MSILPIQKGLWDTNAVKERTLVQQGFNRVYGDLGSMSGYESKNKRVAAVVLIGLSLVLAGGLLFHFHVNTIAAYTLMGGGGVLTIGALVGKVILYLRRNKVSSYTIVSWNIGTLGDYRNMCALKNMRKEEQTLGATWQEYLTGAPYKLKDEEKRARIGLFQQAFTQFNRPDIICLQESFEMTAEELQNLLPPGYCFFSYQNTPDERRYCYRNCTILWNAEKFSKVTHASLQYDPTYITSPHLNPDTLVLLKDRINAMQVCVTSAHLRGFPLTATQEVALEKALPGDNQARYDLCTMDDINADLYIFAGDFNATHEHYPQRLQILTDHGYHSDLTDNSPTIYDANLKEDDGKTPKAVRLDHIYVRSAKKSQVVIQGLSLPTVPLGDFNRPSDHLPIKARIEVVGS